MALPTGQLSDNTLMHFRTKGSKNGVRRYQTESGEWTPLGLKERKIREGWGERRKARKAKRSIAKAEKKIEQLSKKKARQDAREEARVAAAERKRKSKLSGLTDEEMRQKLERAKMEAEYRDLTKRHTFVETGSKLVGKYLDYKSGKEQREIEANRQKIELERLRTQRIQAKENTTQAKYNQVTSKNRADEARAKADEMRENRKGGLKIERKKDLKQTKLNFRNTTIRGAVGNFLNAAAKGKGAASGEYAQDQAHINALIRANKKANKYNAKRPRGATKISPEETKWQREQTEQRERRANAAEIARLNAEKEKWRSKRKI